MARLWWLGAALGAALTVGASGVAEAHPHIFIDAAVDVTFDAQGRVSALHHRWTFDTAFSVWMVQGLDADGDGNVSSAEMQELADENVGSLAEYGFYTYAGEGLEFTSAGDQRMTYAGERVTLGFTVNAVTPEPPGHRFELGVYDPEYYVAISFGGSEDVHLLDAPPGCSATLEPPKPMAPEVEERLYALGPEVLELPPDLAAAMRGTQGLIAISCGQAPPATNALEAVNQAAAPPRSLPFGGPPPEVGLPVWRTGLMGWVQQQQREFYAALTRSLDALRTDWTAFWVLGGLSFAYGVFHAAGPGHGKVVISSYMLANERQLRRGIILSGLSAFMQSLVAIGFVLLLAGLLRVTSTAMGDAAYWVTLLSYGLVVLMGAWLVLRKLFGWGHGHHHAPGPEPAHKRHKARALLYGDDATPAGAQAHQHKVDHHEHEHEHMHHAVGPRDLRGDWREQLTVIVAVGLRPCSGALVVLVFALSQGILAAGIVSVLLMGLGTAITVGVLATLAVTAKNMVRRIGGRDSAVARALTWWAELVGAVAVFCFGVVLVLASL
ncbi:DUF1007 family protein [Devosia sp. PTR5]|uniref:DUF1007 family protein n=1 Tax=Devosia oryzisoli TaxID=2774138 RepID=A0A927IR33_9HYPH|nr:DUF1007 family protein [Devosia oryzisoli]MBD8063979.1 DUF1007 family protein [Devosia oryzisoli]